jgi:hypothetical protein
LGEFYHLHRDARLHPDKFHDYLQIMTNAFDTLEEKAEVHLCGPGTNNKQITSAEKQLVLMVW